MTPPQDSQPRLASPRVSATAWIGGGSEGSHCNEWSSREGWGGDPLVLDPGFLYPKGRSEERSGW